MIKNNLPELVAEILKYDDRMSDKLRKADQKFINNGDLPKWTEDVITDGWLGAMDELCNLDNSDTEIVRINMFRHLAELYVRQAKRKAARLGRKRTKAHKTQVGRNTSDNRVQLKESTIRRRAKVRGLKLEKERNNPTKSVYRLFDPLKNKIVFGGSRKTYWATLEQCAKYIHPEIPMPGQMFNPEQLKSRTKLVLKRFGHLEKLSVRENPADLRRHGTKHDRVRAVLCN